ncbi:class I SAM-dependent methyltransferase [Alicyclobacillus fodiniaquatilis]|uniref:Class I SAM-dependent methyltransferase n=1 Tax=Alicyclobacillus fodiniaquatilis TaxID=1661150 RepID=A0ABW4JCQ5_9BACL
MYDLEDLHDVIQELCNSSLVISPWLAYVGGKVRFDSYIFDLLDWGARDFAAANWRREYVARVFNRLPVPSRLPKTAIYETAASTAVYLSYEQTGQAAVTERYAKDALHLTENFVLQHGFDFFVGAYTLLTLFENYSAIHYYGSIKETDFLSGKLHRPWIDYALDDELILSCTAGTTELFIDDNERYVRLTGMGSTRRQQYELLLQETGYLRKRNQSLRISHFSELEDYNKVVSTIAPNLLNLRFRFLDFCKIQPGSRVLELGCGDGAFTFDGGLADAVGPAGDVIATDPAHKMIDRAIAKRDELQKDWVEFVQTKAEALPFEDASFDAVVGMIFLHLTEIPEAVKEIRRVLKPGGFFCSVHPLRFPMNNPFIKQWFEPFGKLFKSSPKETLLPNEDTVPQVVAEYFSNIQVVQEMETNVYADPDIVVPFFVESVGLFDEQMTSIPWAERTKLIHDLKVTGEQICRTHTRAQLTVDYPIQMMNATAQM